jgi:hypothetical protein
MHDLNILTEVFRGFPQPFQANLGKVPRLGQHCFLSNLFQFITHPTIRQYTFSSLKVSLNKPQQEFMAPHHRKQYSLQELSWREISDLLPFLPRKYEFLKSEDMKKFRLKTGEGFSTTTKKTYLLVKKISGGRKRNYWSSRWESLFLETTTPFTFHVPAYFIGVWIRILIWHTFRCCVYLTTERRTSDWNTHYLSLQIFKSCIQCKYYLQIRAGSSE